MIKDRVWGRVRKILKKAREEDNGDFWTDRILSMKEIEEGLELLERVNQGTTIEAIINEKKKRPNLIITDD